MAAHVERETMKRMQWTMAAIAVCVAWCVLSMAAEPAPSSTPATVGRAYPGLASGALTHARLAELPQGVLLRSGDISVGEKDVAAAGAGTPEKVRAQLDKNGFFVLERIATSKLLAAAARQEAARANRDVSKSADGDVVKEYLSGVLDSIQISDAEVAAFYEQNKIMFGSAAPEAVKTQLAPYLREQKQQEAYRALIESLGEKTAIEVSAPWVKSQSLLTRDNPVDKARLSGKPSLVDFGSKGCVPCDMLAPILETLKKKFDGQANVLFVSVVEEEILAARYGIDSIPVQVFFDKEGKEVSRHVGFFPQQEIEKKLAEMGVK